ncbi:MAG: hypothetical protein NZ770_02810, partial [Candidatus Poseidoniaceae archaeon]|nr:hypothetical protein [Candidatus Poseidoniaceae archaeon]
DTCAWDETEYCTDTDGDGMPDHWEVAVGLNRTNALIAGMTIDESGIDSDGDGLWNQLEYDYDGDPFLTDTDGDCISDDREVVWADGLQGLSNDLKKEFARKAMRSDDANENNISDGDEFNCGANFTGNIIIDDDSDGDGVEDSVDLCPNTIAGTNVGVDGCEQIEQSDSDGDGIPDGNDECPETPSSTPVTPKGCSDQQLRDKASDETNADDVDNSANFMMVIMIIAVILLTGSIGGILMSRRSNLEVVDDITLHAEMGGSLEPTGDYTTPTLDATAIPVLDGTAGPVLDGTKDIPVLETEAELEVTEIPSQASEVDMSLFPGWGQDVVQAYMEQGWTVEQLKEWYEGNS